MKHYFIKLDFIAKDSVPYKGEVEVPKEIFDLYQDVLKGKSDKDEIFSNIGSNDVNAFLKSLSSDCTPKLLRTIKCNETLIKELRKKNVTAQSRDIEKIRAMYEANFEIAKTLNHQKNIGKNQKDQEDKAKDKLKKSKSRIEEIKKNGKEKLRKLQDELDACKQLWSGDKLKKKKEDIKVRKEKLEAQLNRAILGADKAEFALDKKKGTAQISLGTSLAAYADAQLIYSWCKDMALPIDKIYNKSLQKKHCWAENAPADFWRNYP